MRLKITCKTHVSSCKLIFIVWRAFSVYRPARLFHSAPLKYYIHDAVFQNMDICFSAGVKAGTMQMSEKRPSEKIDSSVSLVY